MCMPKHHVLYFSQNMASEQGSSAGLTKGFYYFPFYWYIFITSWCLFVLEDSLLATHVLVEFIEKRCTAMVPVHRIICDTESNSLKQGKV